MERAVAASRGSEVRIMDEARVRGMSGEWEESGIAFWLSVGVEERGGVGDGEDILVFGGAFVGWWWR